MAFQRIASFKPTGCELYQSDASPNGVITPLGVGALCIVQLAGSVALWQCTVLPSTWVNLTGGGGSGVPLSSITAATATNTIDSLTFAQVWGWSTLTTQTAFALTANGLTSGDLLDLSSTSLTQTGHLLDLTVATTGALGTGAARFRATGAHTGSVVHVDTATLTGVGLNIVAAALTSGRALNVYSASAGLTGNLALFTSDSTGNLASGAVSIVCTGAHTGSALGLLSATVAGSVVAISSSAMTTGTQIRGVADALTTGSLLDLSTSSASLNSTLGLLRVANTSSSTTGITARIQSNSTVGSGLTVLGNGNVGLGTAAPLATFHNAGSSLYTTLPIADVPAGGQIGSAATTVDVASSFTVNQTTAGPQALTLPNPTNATAGRMVWVANIGTQSFTMYGVTVTVVGTPATAAIQLMWTGTAWVVVQ